MTRSVPGHESRRSSIAASMSESTSLVGSSRAMTLGSSRSRSRSCRRRFCPPERSSTRAERCSRAKPSRSSSWAGVWSLPSIVKVALVRASTSRTRSPPICASWENCWSRKPSRTVLPRLTRPALGSTSPEISPRSVDLPAPLAPRMPVRSPGAIRHVTSRRIVRSPKVTLAPSRSMTSLPSRATAIRCSSMGLRTGGTSAMSWLAASMRNFGFDVRAGAPRRSHASSLRMRFCRFCSVAALIRSRSTR